MSPVITKRCTRQRGLTLVELMIAVAIGLFVSTVAIKIAVDTIGQNQARIAEIRMNQNLRAAADIIARDLRRAAYWDASISGVWRGAQTVLVPNPYRRIAMPANGTLVYGYQLDPDPALPVSEFQFRRSLRDGVGVLQYCSAAVCAEKDWQLLTDPSAVNILDGFEIRVIGPATQPDPDGADLPGRTVELYDLCPCHRLAFPPASCPGLLSDLDEATQQLMPKLVIRQFEIRIPAQANTGRTELDAQIQRELVERVRVRNDALLNPGNCPS